MKIYTKYIFKNLFAPTFFITVSLTCVVWLSQSLRFVDFIINQGLPLTTFLYFITLLLPSLLWMVLPVALFCTTIYIYNKLLYESELLVLKASGISRLGIAKPLIILAFLVTIISYSISLYFLPVSYREFKDLQFYLQDNYASLLLQEGVFNTPAKGLAVYIKERQSDGTLIGILVHDNRNPEKPQTVMAEKGLITDGPEGVRFVMNNASRQQIDRQSGEVNILYFDSYPMDISFYTDKNLTRLKKKDELFLHELLYPRSDISDKERKKLLAEAHERLSWPLYNFALPLLVLSFLLTGDFNRRGQARQIVAAITISILLVIINIGIKNIAAGGSQFGIIMMYAMPLSVIITSLYILATNTRFSLFEKGKKEMAT
ncbi:MAG: LPS export ABC transporter permease LptF [Alphaproteobacteria bacterium CG11_big_fil_rev_8_21_14_0_20_44_7]|nr:MAG: LPS export ABC transporter permease LptF [Alphaproteobacteria bacterium CG11_big_fil_rev_8_21_14_0_20_44_7]